MNVLIKKMRISYRANKGRTVVEYAVLLALIIFIYWALTAVLD